MNDKGKYEYFISAVKNDFGIIDCRIKKSINFITYHLTSSFINKVAIDKEMDYIELESKTDCEIPNKYRN